MTAVLLALPVTGFLPAHPPPPAITLFEVFKAILEDNADPAQPFPSLWTSLPAILGDTARLAGVGAGVGLAMALALGYLLRWGGRVAGRGQDGGAGAWAGWRWLGRMLWTGRLCCRQDVGAEPTSERRRQSLAHCPSTARWLRWHGVQPGAEGVAVLATGYLAFYVANAPAQVGGLPGVGRSSEACFPACGSGGRQRRAVAHVLGWGEPCPGLLTARAARPLCLAAGLGRHFGGGVRPVGQPHPPVGHAVRTHGEWSL